MNIKKYALKHAKKYLNIYMEVQIMKYGYYFNDTNNKTIDKCNIKCKTCNQESHINNLCLSCNVDNKYYPILNNNSNTNSFIDCYNYAPSRYIFDNYSLSYKPCYSSCKECSKIGDNNNHQCL